MKINYLQVQSPQFTKALAKMATFGGFTDYRQLANIKTVLKQFEKLADTAQKEWIELLKQFCQLDEKGNFIPSEGKAGTFTVTPGREMEFKTAADSFNAKVADIWADPIHFEDVSKVGFSPADLMQLEGIILEPRDWVDTQTTPKAATV